MNAPLQFLEGFARGLAAGLLVLAAVLSISPAKAGELWTRKVLAEDVAITVHVVSVDELRRLRGVVSWGLPTADQTSRQGLAKLYRNRETGAWTCEVYVTKDSTEETLAHERRHCQGWVHK